CRHTRFGSTTGIAHLRHEVVFRGWWRKGFRALSRVLAFFIPSPRLCAPLVCADLPPHDRPCFLYMHLCVLLQFTTLHHNMKLFVRHCAHRQCICVVAFPSNNWVSSSLVRFIDYFWTALRPFSSGAKSHSKRFYCHCYYFLLHFLL